MHSDSDNSPTKRRKANKSILDSSSSSDESDIPVRKRKHRQRVTSSSSDSDGSFIFTHSHKKPRVLSDCDSDSSSGTSDSEVEEVFRKVVGKKKPRVFDSDSDSSEGNKRGKKFDNGESGSQSSDEESERCIICFKVFRGPVAHPSGCIHNFHSECLLTWSKTSNTCPIDRVKYTQVIVINPEGGIISRHEVSTPPPQDHNDLEPDDPTFCEVCHQHDREHEMLLCDRCEAGYHMNCLNPPLFEVPLGNWFCPHCSRSAIDEMIDEDEVNDLLREGGVLESRLRYRAPTVSIRRVGPRSRAAQRVIASIREMAEQAERYQPSSSTSRSTSRRNSRRTKSNHRKGTRSYKVELITVEDGSTIEVKVAVNTKVRRKKKSCGRGKKKKSRNSSSSAGFVDSRGLDHSVIRPLDIMGSRPQLEYFSGCEAEDELEEDGGLSTLRARSSVSTVRGMTNRKQIAAQVMRLPPRRPTPRIAVSSAPPDLLSSILNEQTKWHSPNAVIHSNSNGEVRVVLPDKHSSNTPVKKAAGNDTLGNSNGTKTSSPPPSENGGRSEPTGEGPSSSSIPPLQPPPQPVFSRVYEDEDFDLYADIEPPRLAPPPEPPALLLALEGDEAASSPEDTMLVIDDRQTYDPDVPTSPPPSPPEKESVENEAKNSIAKPSLSATNQDTLDLSSIRLPSPEPEIDDCPNRVFYSETSINIAKEKQDSDGEMEMPSHSVVINKSNIELTLETGALSNNKINVEVNDESRDKCDDGTKMLEEEKPSEEFSTSNGEFYKNHLKSEDNNAETPAMIYDPEISEDGDDCPKYDDTDKSAEENSIVNNDEGKINFGEEINKNEYKSEEKLQEKDLEEKVIEKIEEMKLEETDIEKKMQFIEANKEEKIQIEDLEETETKVKLEEELNVEEGELKDNDNDVLLDNDELKENKTEMLDNHSSPGTPNSVNVFEVNKDINIEDDDESDTNDKSSGRERESNNEEKPNEHDTSPESTPPRKVNSEKITDQEGEDVLELGCGEDERDGLVDITDEEISTYEKSWELEDNNTQNEKTAGLEGLETEAISEGEDNMAEDGQVRTATENGPKEEGEIISDEKRVPVAWKKVTKAKERSYREKESVKEKNKKKDKKPKEKRKELERYDVRKIISDKPKKRKVDEFGRDISPSRSRSLSDSRSKSRSRSIRSRSVRSRRSRSRSRSRSRRRRSRERKSRNRSRGRSRGRSRIRSRDRSKRRARSKSRSRSDSRRRKSRSPRKKERRSRAKSREKKRRKRDSSISCSSCSCSSCERERRKSKKLTVTVPNEPVRKDKKKTKYKDRDLKRRRVGSPVPSKEVFTSGDNILVSVNFKSSKSGEIGRKEPSKKKKDEESKKKKDKSSKENQPLRSIVSRSSNQQSRKNRINARNLKPVAIIDLAQSPFREQTLSPKEIIVLTDSDSDEKRKSDENNIASCQVTGPKTPPEPHIKFNIISSKPQMLRSLTNPLLDSVDQLEGEGEEEDERVEIPHKGPNTPPEPPVPYDPFEPTKSRSPTPIQELEESHNPPTPPGDKILPPEPPQRPTSPPKPPPEPPKTPSPLHSPPPKPPEDIPPEKAHISPPNICNDDSMDIGGGDSPYSPGSSDGEDIFEPPVPQMATPVPLSKSKSRPGAKLLPKLTPSPLKRKPGPNKTTTPLKSNKAPKKDIGLKLDEDQLKILDDLPNSAVEMQVKDKFLKKLNRQERVVEEVKMVLKPHYAKKHVNKEEYKEILRKSVPKICHSRSGEINPLKIQRLIEAYVKKYRHLRKKRKMGGVANFSAPESILLLKPKPKATMWC